MKKTAKFIFLAFENRDITLDVLNTLHEMMANVDSLLRKALLTPLDRFDPFPNILIDYLLFRCVKPLNGRSHIAPN